MAAVRSSLRFLLLLSGLATTSCEAGSGVDTGSIDPDPPPPPMPPVPASPGAAYRSIASGRFTLTGSADSFDAPAFRSGLRMQFPRADAVTVSVSEGSVVAVVRLIMRNAGDASAAAQILRTTSPAVMEEDWFGGAVQIEGQVADVTSGVTLVDAADLLPPASPSPPPVADLDAAALWYAVFVDYFYRLSAGPFQSAARGAGEHLTSAAGVWLWVLLLLLVLALPYVLFQKHLLPHGLGRIVGCARLAWARGRQRKRWEAWMGCAPPLGAPCALLARGGCARASALSHRARLRRVACVAWLGFRLRLPRRAGGATFTRACRARSTAIVSSSRASGGRTSTKARPRSCSARRLSSPHSSMSLRALGWAQSSTCATSSRASAASTASARSRCSG